MNSRKDANLFHLQKREGKKEGKEGGRKEGRKVRREGGKATATLYRRIPINTCRINEENRKSPLEPNDICN